ncbi:MAG: hypothetical protein HWE30_02305 [Methylocystaceae bacterium]|nr:hypothetical protein [Methylocystaceae bacterium]
MAGMISGLLSIAGVVISAVPILNDFKSKKEREETVRRLLETYFLISDTADSAELLLSEAGDDPIKNLQSMDPLLANEALEKWDGLLRKQLMRLLTLKNYLSGDRALLILNPDLQKRIDRIIGSKFDDAVNLRAIGATLFYHAMFPTTEKDEKVAGLIKLIFGKGDGPISIEENRARIAELKECLIEYRKHLQVFVEIGDFDKLSLQARHNTEIQ